MKNVICIITLVYYSIGSLILPSSDFSFAPELPKMYAHCKATEDKDMGFIDFITDHLVNIDGIFDNHDNGDDQKPHEPSQHQNSAAFVFITSFLYYDIKPTVEFTKGMDYLSINKYHFDFVAYHFRPPIG